MIDPYTEAGMAACLGLAVILACFALGTLWCEAMRWVDEGVRNRKDAKRRRNRKDAIRRRFHMDAEV